MFSYARLVNKMTKVDEVKEILLKNKTWKTIYWLNQFVNLFVFLLGSFLFWKIIIHLSAKGDVILALFLLFCLVYIIYLFVFASITNKILHFFYSSEDVKEISEMNFEETKDADFGYLYIRDLLHPLTEFLREEIGKDYWPKRNHYMKTVIYPQKENEELKKYEILLEKYRNETDELKKEIRKKKLLDFIDGRNLTEKILEEE